MAQRYNVIVLPDNNGLGRPALTPEENGLLILYNDVYCKHDEYKHTCMKCKQEKCEKHDYMPVTCHNDTEYICRWCGKEKNE